MTATIDTAPPPFAVLELLNGLWIARAIHVAADLGVADLVADGPRAAAELAAETGTHAPSLERLLRALTTVGIFSEPEPGVFAQTPRSACLSSTHPASVRNAARMFGADWQLRSWNALGHTIETGRPAFDHVHGTGLVEYLTGTDAGDVFDAAMLDMSAFLNHAIIGGYEFEGRVVADVGGGHSSLLADLLESRPELEGVLVDRPEVIERHASTAARCRLAAADIASAVPATADVYVLNRVLHDWDDERAAAILRAVRAAMPAGGRVLIVEQILDPHEPSKRTAFLDLQMLQIRGGRERTGAELGALLDRAGLTLAREIPTPSPMTLIEAIARPE